MGLSQGCGHGGWFKDAERAEVRAGHIRLVRGDDSVPFQIKPCLHPGHHDGGVHLVEVTPALPAGLRVPGGDFPPATRLLIRTRAGHGDPCDAVCEACGTWLGDKGGEFQHRYARGMGGCRLPVIRCPANGCLLCGQARWGTGCHGYAETRPADMNLMGFWLETGQDPVATPIRLYGRAGGTEAKLLAADAAAYLDPPPSALGVAA